MGCGCDVGVPMAVYLQCVWGCVGVLVGGWVWVWVWVWDALFLPRLHEGHPFVFCISRHLGPVLPPHDTKW
jgi:hypothetical protein